MQGYSPSFPGGLTRLKIRLNAHARKAVCYMLYVVCNMYANIQYSCRLALIFDEMGLLGGLWLGSGAGFLAILK